MRKAPHTKIFCPNDFSPIFLYVTWMENGHNGFSWLLVCQEPLPYLQNDQPTNHTTIASRSSSRFLLHIALDVMTTVCLFTQDVYSGYANTHMHTHTWINVRKNIFPFRSNLQMLFRCTFCEVTVASYIHTYLPA